MNKESEARIIDLTEYFKNFLAKIPLNNDKNKAVLKFKEHYINPSAEYLVPLRSFANLWFNDPASFFNNETFDVTFYTRLLERLSDWNIKDAVAEVHRNAEELAGHNICCDIILFFTFGHLIDGITVYFGGRPTIYIGLDYPEADKSYLETIAGHEIGHAARDSTPGVLESYGANIDMEHGSLLSITPFSEHFIGEGMATFFSKLLIPGHPEKHYLFYGDDALLWCEKNFGFIEEKLLKEANQIGNIGRYYRKGSLREGSPGREDYFYGFKVVESVYKNKGIKELLGMSSRDILRHYFSGKSGS